VKPAALALGLLLALPLAGCGGDQPKAAEPTTPTAPPSSLPAAVGTLQGKLLLVGGPAPGTPVPVAGKLTIDGNGSVVHADIAADGRFAIQLAPGVYQVSATSPRYNNSDGVCRTSPPVKVLASGKTVTVDVYCQMK